MHSPTFRLHSRLTLVIGYDAAGGELSQGDGQADRAAAAAGVALADGLPAAVREERGLRRFDWRRRPGH